MDLLNLFTQFLANKLCNGSTRKLIAGWWYTILGISFFLILMTFYIVPTRTRSEAFTSCWSSLALICLCVGGTMVMRKFHNSFSTGLFLGGVVGGAQFYFLLFLLYGGFTIERSNNGAGIFYDVLEAGICFAHSMLLGSFAMMLGAHRSEIIDRNASLNDESFSTVHNPASNETEDDATYDPPILS